MNFAPPIARRLAFVGEFNSTPYVLIPSRVQKELILDARKNNSNLFSSSKTNLIHFRSNQWLDRSVIIVRFSLPGIKPIKNVHYPSVTRTIQLE